MTQIGIVKCVDMNYYSHSLPFLQLSCFPPVFVSYMDSAGFGVIENLASRFIVPIYSSCKCTVVKEVDIGIIITNC